MCSCPAHRELVDCICDCDHGGDRIVQWKARATSAEAALDQLRAYARWCEDRSVEPDERDILALADGTCRDDYVALMATDAPHSPAEPVSPVSTPTEAHGETGEAQDG